MIPATTEGARLMLATLRDLARQLGCRTDQAEDVVRSERSARAALSRRWLFQAVGAVAAGSVWSFGAASGTSMLELAGPPHMMPIEWGDLELSIGSERFVLRDLQVIGYDQDHRRVDMLVPAPVGVFEVNVSIGLSEDEHRDLLLRLTEETT